jgi:hypothetical protein
MRNLHVHYLAADHIRLRCLLEPRLVRPQIESLHTLRTTCRCVTALLPCSCPAASQAAALGCSYPPGGVPLVELLGGCGSSQPATRTMQHRCRSAAVLEQHMLVKTSYSCTQLTHVGWVCRSGDDFTPCIATIAVSACRVPSEQLCPWQKRHLPAATGPCCFGFFAATP